MNRKRILKFLLVLITFIVIFGLNLNFKSRNSDVFFHIKTGEYIAANHVIPDKDIFSYTAEGKEWVPHEYLPAVLFYFFYDNFGIESLMYLKAAILTLMFYIFFKLINKESNLYVSLALTLFAAFTTEIYAYVRPHIFFWFFLVLIFVIFRYRKYYYLPLLILIWGNVHSSVLIGLVIISIYLFELFLTKKQIKFIYMIITCFIAALINPSTYKIFLLPFSILRLSSSVNEWRPYSIDSFWFWFYLIFVLAIILIFILNIKKNKNKKYILIFLMFAILGFKSKRYVASSILVNIILIQPYLGFLKNKIKRSNAKDYFFIIITILLVIFSIAKLNAFNPKVPWRYFGKGAINFVKDNNIEGNMYNSYELGGPVILMLYPEYRVFIDGRIDVYGEEIVEDYYDIRYGENLKELIGKYDISFFIIDNKGKIGKLLYDGDDYKLVFFDSYYSVYLEKDKGIRGFEIINPYYALDPKENTEIIINELEYLLSLDQSNLNAYRNLGMLYYFEKKDNEKALYYFSRYIDKNPKDKEIKVLIKNIENE